MTRQRSMEHLAMTVIPVPQPIPAPLEFVPLAEHFAVMATSMPDVARPAMMETQLQAIAVMLLAPLKQSIVPAMTPIPAALSIPATVLVFVPEAVPLAATAPLTPAAVSNAMTPIRPTVM